MNINDFSDLRRAKSELAVKKADKKMTESKLATLGTEISDLAIAIEIYESKYPGNFA
jgi:hypothetical protein